MSGGLSVGLRPRHWPGRLAAHLVPALNAPSTRPSSHAQKDALPPPPSRPHPHGSSQARVRVLPAFHHRHRAKEHALPLRAGQPEEAPREHSMLKSDACSLESMSALRMLRHHLSGCHSPEGGEEEKGGGGTTCWPRQCKQCELSPDFMRVVDASACCSPPPPLQCCIDLKANQLRFGSTDISLPFLAEHEIPKNDMEGSMGWELDPASDSAKAEAAAAAEAARAAPGGTSAGEQTHKCNACTDEVFVGGDGLTPPPPPPSGHAGCQLILHSRCQ
jgi:hypothetical protein